MKNIPECLGALDPGSHVHILYSHGQGEESLRYFEYSYGKG